MPRRMLACLVVAVLVAGAFVACSDQSPVAPGATPHGVGNPSLLSQPAPGSYDISFFTSGTGGLVPVDSLPVCTVLACPELILGAHVEDGTGAAAQSGAVTFQYCSLKGLPPSDIERADEAPSAACANGSATWANLPASVPVNASGDAYLDFGFVLIPRTVGFRFRYLGQGSGIANDTSAPEDFKWFAP